MAVTGRTAGAPATSQAAPRPPDPCRSGRPVRRWLTPARYLWLTLAFSLSTSGKLNAQSWQPTHKAVEFVFGVGVSTYDPDLRGLEPAFLSKGVRSRFQTNPLLWGAVGIRWRTAVELLCTSRIRPLRNISFGGVAASFQLHVPLYFLSASAQWRGRPPAGVWAAHPYVGVGIGRCHFAFDRDFEDQPYYEPYDGDFGIMGNGNATAWHYTGGVAVGRDDVRRFDFFVEMLSARRLRASSIVNDARDRELSADLSSAMVGVRVMTYGLSEP